MLLIILASGLKQSLPSLMTAFLPIKKLTTHTAEIIWLIIVASAAPATPMSNVKIKIGSSTIFITAPKTVVIIPVLGNPCAFIYPLSPVVSIENRVPER